MEATAAFAIIAAMALRPIADPTETDPIAKLIEAGQYRAALLRAARALGDELGQYCLAVLDDHHLAERAVLDTLVDLYRAMPHVQSIRLRPWLFGRARHACAALQARGPGTGAFGHGPAERQPEPRAEPVCREMRSRLRGLRPDERDAGLLRYLARLDYTEIARICGTDEGTAREWTSKALLRLRQQLADDAVRSGIPPRKPGGDGAGR